MNHKICILRHALCIVFLLCLTASVQAQTDIRAVQQALAQVIHNHPEPICGDTIAQKLSKKFAHSPEMQTAIAAAYMKNNNRERAEHYLAKANSISHNGMRGYAPALIIQADILRDYNYIDSAAVFYDQAIAVDPTNPDAYINYAMMYAKYGDTQKGIAKLEQMRTALPTYNVDATIADVYTMAQDERGATSFYEKTDLDLLRKDQVLSYAIGLYEQKKYVEGIALLNKIRTKWPKEKQINRLMLWHCAAAQHYDDAITNARVFLDMTPKDSVWSIDYFALGSSYLMNTVPTTMTYAEAQDAAFDAFTQCEAKDDMWKAVKKNIPSVFTAATTALRDQKRYDEALALMRRYIAHRGKDASAFNHISVIQTLNAQLTEIDSDSRTMADAQPLMQACTDFIRQFPDNENLDYIMFLKWRWLTSFDTNMDYTALQEALDLYRHLKGIADRDKGQNSRLVLVIRYLASYNYEKLNRRTRAKEYWREILEIDPDDEVANRMLGQ